MGKSINKLSLSLFIVLYILMLMSCSRSASTIKTQSILLNQTAEVSIKYEYDVVTINVPVNVVQNQPTAYRFSIHARENPSELFIERLFFPEDDIQVVLPRDIFSPDSLGNVAILEPVGGNFEKLIRLFTVSRLAEQNLDYFQIRPKRDLLKIFIFTRTEKKPLPQAHIEIKKGDLILARGITDSLGYSRIQLEKNEDYGIPLKISVNTDGLYPLWKREIMVPETGILKQNILLGSLKFFEDGVVLYKVVKDLSPLREGPENGAATKFLLAYGDRFYSSKVAGDRLYGEVEVFTGDSHQSTFFQGWILKSLVELEN